jgi:hypothetical protein
MSDWQIGDEALCIGGDGWMSAIGAIVCDGPVKGSVNTVRAVKETPQGTFLGFAKWPRQGFYHKAFVKVTPSPELIAEEREAGVLV